MHDLHLQVQEDYLVTTMKREAQTQLHPCFGPGIQHTHQKKNIEICASG